MEKMRGKVTYFMGMPFTQRWRDRETLVETSASRKEMLREHILNGFVMRVAQMLGEHPELIPAMTRTLTGELTKVTVSPNGFYLESIVAMSRQAGNGNDKDMKVQTLGRLLGHKDLTARHLAIQALVSAVSNDGADLLFAEKALLRSLEEYDLAKEAAIALAHQYMTKLDPSGIGKLLSHDNHIVKTWAAKVIGTKAANGDPLAVEALLAGCENSDHEMRQVCARNLSGALFTADAEVKAFIRDGIRQYKDKAGLVHLDVLREFQETEKLLDSKRRGEA
jgi:hypothetical protein